MEKYFHFPRETMSHLTLPFTHILFHTSVPAFLSGPDPARLPAKHDVIRVGLHFGTHIASGRRKHRVQQDGSI
jgi:hypothetical protein